MKNKSVRIDKKKLINLASITCLALFLFFLFKQGPLRILNKIIELSWKGVLALLVLRLFYWWLRAISWKIICNCYDRRPPLNLFFWSRLAGNAVSFFTPVTQLGGEAVRVLMLDKADKKKVLASAVLDKTIEIMATALLIIIGIFWALPVLHLSNAQRLIALGVSVLMTLSLFFIFLKQKANFFTWIVGSLKKMRIKPKILEKNREKIKETDRYISLFYTEHRPIFFLVLGLYLLVVLIWVIEVHVTFLFISPKYVPFLSSFILVTFGSILLAIPTLPASFGLYEVSYITMYSLLGIPLDAGLALLVIRRVFGLFWAGVGMFPIIKKSSIGTNSWQKFFHKKNKPKVTLIKPEWAEIPAANQPIIGQSHEPAKP